MLEPYTHLAYPPSGRWLKFNQDFKARAFLLKENHWSIVGSAEEFLSAYGPSQVISIAEKLPEQDILARVRLEGKKKPPTTIKKLKPEVLAYAVFKTILDTKAVDPYDLQSRREADVAAGRRQARKKDGLRYEVLYDSKSKKHQEVFEGLPRQAKLLLTFLLEKQAAGIVMSQPNVEQLVDELKVQLKTKQEPWRVFKFYQTKFIQLDLLRIRQGGK